MAFAIIISIYCFYLLYENNFDFSKKLYAYCPGSNSSYSKVRICENPIPNSNLAQYCHEDWCKQEWLYPGEYGEKFPKDLFGNFAKLAWGGLLVLLVINHLIHNRGKIPDFEMPIWGDKVLNLRDIFKHIRDAKEGFGEDESNQDNGVEPKS